MKKMYKKPETEVLNINAEHLMDSMGASPQGSYHTGGEGGDIPDAD